MLRAWVLPKAIAWLPYDIVTFEPKLVPGANRFTSVVKGPPPKIYLTSVDTLLIFTIDFGLFSIILVCALLSSIEFVFIWLYPLPILLYP